MSAQLKAALEYARRGWSVFPVKKGGKHPLTAHGLKDASIDEIQIRRWWKENPDANIGIATGAISRFVVVDIDSSDAKTKIDELLKSDGISHIPTVKTGKGWQLYFKHPGSAIRNRTGMLPGVDFRGDGGYVVAPPSIHENGNSYTWISEPRLLSDLPEKLLELITSKTSQHEQRPDMSGRHSTIREGERNNTLASLAGTMRGIGFQHEAISKALLIHNREHCEPPLDEQDVEKIAASISSYPANESKENPWDKAKSASALLAEDDEPFNWIVKDLLASGSITMIAAPRGLGKTQVAHGLAVILAQGGFFRGEQIRPQRVLLLDRDNSYHVIKDRFSRWGAENAGALYVLGRNYVPALTDRKSWECFPIGKHDVVIIDSWGSFTEGVTEKEGKETTQILATLLNLASKGVAVLLLNNTTKDGSSLRGRGELADRVDILYEVRDGTGLTPSGKKHWWEELPEAGEGTFASRASRRRGRTALRLAFIPSKFRMSQEPDPFCLELDLSEQKWSLIDVTTELAIASRKALETASEEEKEKLEQAAKALEALLIERDNQNKPVLKTEAVEFLRGHGLTLGKARDVVDEKNGTLWSLRRLPGGQGLGRPIALIPYCGDRYNFISTTEKINKREEITLDGKAYSVGPSPPSDSLPN